MALWRSFGWHTAGHLRQTALRRPYPCLWAAQPLHWNGSLCERSCSTSSSDDGAAAGNQTEASPLASTTDSSGSGLFSDDWWPSVADQVHRRLAMRGQGLPEDPLAQGVLSFIEYELASKAAGVGGGTKQAEEDTNRDRVPSPDAPVPLPEGEEWRWLLRGAGEIIGPKGRNSY
mmetsp:Transcript_21290/g.38875  ORF Transcript_21290/g.38875 Transcript_21290/m.38875 type:complete len:174 (-) Transcript_21290:20-541(-)